jgi:small conductance mechanosensitive channel
MYAILIFMIVGQLGVSTASIVTVMGAAGLAISMSLQGSLANVAGGILILLMKPFRVGDYVMTSFGDGTVQAIGLVYTTITTVDNRVLTVPNGTLSNSAVFDASMMPERRLDISVGISYDSDIRRAKEIMEEVYRSCPAVIVDKGINVHVSSLGDSAVVIEAFGWVPGSEFLSSKWYVTEQIKLRFDEGGIKIPYPQMDVHLDTVAGAGQAGDKA